MKRVTTLAVLTATTLALNAAAQSDGRASSTDELLAEIASLRVEDVAWRQIEWETCLLEGLRRSREENKPLILWVFIDRPVDDERC